MPSGVTSAAPAAAALDAEAMVVAAWLAATASSILLASAASAARPLAWAGLGGDDGGAASTAGAGVVVVRLVAAAVAPAVFGWCGCAMSWCRVVLWLENSPRICTTWDTSPWRSSAVSFERSSSSLTVDRCALSVSTAWSTFWPSSWTKERPERVSDSLPSTAVTRFESASSASSSLAFAVCISSLAAIVVATAASSAASRFSLCSCTVFWSALWAFLSLSCAPEIDSSKLRRAAEARSSCSRIVARWESICPESLVSSAEWPRLCIVSHMEVTAKATMKTIAVKLRGSADPVMLECPRPSVDLYGVRPQVPPLPAARAAWDRFAEWRW